MWTPRKGGHPPRQAALGGLRFQGKRCRPHQVLTAPQHLEHSLRTGLAFSSLCLHASEPPGPTAHLHRSLPLTGGAASGMARHVAFPFFFPSKHRDDQPEWDTGL